jgi:hypothetical protein
LVFLLRIYTLDALFLGETATALSLPSFIKLGDREFLKASYLGFDYS